MTILGIVLLATFVSVIFLHLHTVDLRHNIASAQTELEDLKVENSELKNNFYSMMDSENLEKLAAERGLVKEKNPQWAFASEY